LQYGLTTRTYDLGWPDEWILIIDDDLGKVGISTDGRGGFQRLVSEAFGAQFLFAGGRARGAIAAVAVELCGGGQGQVLGHTRHQALLVAGEPQLQRNAHRPATTMIADISYFWKGSAGNRLQRLLSRLWETAFISYLSRYPLSAPRSPPARPVRYARSNETLSSARPSLNSLHGGAV